MKMWKLARRSGILAIISTSSFLAISPFYLYDQFNSERPIAHISFQQLNSQEYIAKLSQGDFCQQKHFAIFGDQWQLDASFIKWKGFAVTLGFESLYRLDRLAGRYKSTEQQNSRPTLAHNLSPDIWLDIFADKNDTKQSAFLIDTSFGSSVYLDIDPSLTYTVYKTEDALIAKASPRTQSSSENGDLTIEINQACGQNPKLLTSMSQNLNELALDIFN